MYEVSGVKFECFNVDRTIIANITCKDVNRQRVSWYIEYVPGKMNDVWVSIRVYHRGSSSQSYTLTPLGLKTDLCQLSKSKNKLIEKVVTMFDSYDPHFKEGCPFKGPNRGENMDPIETASMVMLPMIPSGDYLIHSRVYQSKNNNTIFETKGALSK